MRLLAVYLLLAFGLAGAHAAELRVALGLQEGFVRPAAGKAQTGGLVAFNEELARELCRRLQARCTLLNLPFAEILPTVEEHRVDLGFGNFLRTPERERRVDFSDPIWRSSSRLLALSATARRYAGHPDGDLTPDRLRQVRIGAIVDTQQQAYLRDVAGDHGLVVVGIATMAETMNQLRDGKIDFALLPMLSAYALAAREPPGSYEFVGPPVTGHGLGGSVHIALPKGEDGLRKALNKAIAAMRADGSWHRIVRRHFPFNLD